VPDPLMDRGDPDPLMEGDLRGVTQTHWNFAKIHGIRKLQSLGIVWHCL